jgi:ribosome-associated translation inhibitor RaiA
MDQPSVQQVFFQHIKSNLASHLSMVDEVAELLNISNDSAYRRIRGEKPLSFEEINVLCSKYHISMDQLFHLKNDSFLFSGPLANKDNFGFEMYLEHLLNQLNYFNSFEQREFYYLSKDLFIFHHFGFHELTVFKFFFWMKTILQYPFAGKEIVVLDSIRESVFKIASKISEAYNKIPSVEIWNEESINATIMQIDYYRQSKIFPSDEHAINVYKSLLDMINHIEKQVEAGCKFPLDGKPNAASVSYKFYVNEFILGDNCSLAVLNNIKVVYLNHATLNVIMTKDPVFTEYTYQHCQNIMRRSTLMSNAGEKDRTRFFNSMREKVERKMKLI